MLERTTYPQRQVRVVWLALGLLLVLLGFLLDPVTAVGHHALLIGGGVVIGWNLHA